MERERQSELIGGLILAALGAAVVAYALAHYRLGTLRQIGPGFLPVTLGALLAVLGLLIAWVAQPAPPRPRRLRGDHALAITLSVVAFALLLERAGFVPAIVASVLIATQPWSSGGWRQRIALALGATAFVWIVFRLGLSMQIQPFVF